MTTQHDELSAIKEWYRYNSYVRKKYIAAIEKLPHEEIKRDRGASFPTFLDILAHTMESYSDWFFLRYGLKSPLSSNNLTGRIKSIQELRSTETKIDLAVLNFVEGLGPSELDNTFETSDESNKWRFTLKEMLWHLVDEELQHRGELNALFWQMNIDPPVTDWLDWKIEIGEIKPVENISK